MVCHSINRSPQSSVDNHKTPYELSWSAISGKQSKPDLRHLLIPSSRCITYVDKLQRVVGENFNTNGARSVFLGYRGTSNRLVWILHGGIFLLSPHVTTYEKVGNNFSWPLNPDKVMKSLQMSLQRRLKARKTDYARDVDYKWTRSK